MEATMKIGSRIREIRKAAGLTQVEAAEAAGLTQPVWARAESNRADLRVNTVEKLATALGVTPADLLRPVGSRLLKPGKG
jgi:transcriptional regulator with XRE-family HTH domain